MDNPRHDDGFSIGDLLKKIIPKTKPSKKLLAGRRLAQQLLSAKLAAAHANLKAQATVASIKKGVVVIEVQSSALFQELEGFQRQSLLEAFRAGGLQVREVRVKLVSA